MRRPLAISALLAAPLVVGSSAAASFQPAQPVDWSENGYPVWTPELMALPDLPTAPEGATRIDVNLNGYVLGLKMIDADYDGWVGPQVDGAGSYALRSDLSTSGLGAVLKKLRIWAVTTGRYDGEGLQPLTHTQQNRDKKRRRVEMAYDYDASTVDVSVIPPNGSQGVPPASPAERFGADDTLSGLLNIMVQRSVMGEPVCSGTVPVFDSKQHYRLRLANRGVRDWKKDGYRGPVTRCDIYYEPVSGFDPEDLPDADEQAAPIKVWLAPLNDGSGRGYDVPIRFTYKISGFRAVIKVDELSVRFADGTTFEMD